MAQPNNINVKKNGVIVCKMVVGLEGFIIKIT